MTKNTWAIEGKTIKSIDTNAINMWKITFTDGSSVELWIEIDGPMGLPQLWLDNITLQP
jgi:hypothetical protein